MIPPFYVGQKVIAVDAMENSMFKNGTIYTVSAMDYHLGNPSHPIGRVTYYWYIGIVGHSDGGAYYRPSIFAPIVENVQTMEYVSQEVIKKELVSLN